MKKCQNCKVPLDGTLGKIANILFKIKPSSRDVNLCNKCEAKLPKKYRCQLCNRDIDEDVALEHIKAEEYIINLIKKDRPEWNKGEKTCEECIEYYRRLVKEAEI